MIAHRRESAVSFYPTDHPALNITVKSRLAALLGQKQEEFRLASDWADFRYRCGVAEGYREAIAICDEVFKELSER